MRRGVEVEEKTRERGVSLSWLLLLDDDNDDDDDFRGAAARQDGPDFKF